MDDFYAHQSFEAKGPSMRHLLEHISGSHVGTYEGIISWRTSKGIAQVLGLSHKDHLKEGLPKYWELLQTKL